MKIIKVRALSNNEISKILGGAVTSKGNDSVDCTSELESAGTTTDTDSASTQDSVDCTSELASGGTTTDTSISK
jgi:hypothetical protein